MKKLIILALMSLLVPASAMAMKSMDHGKMEMADDKMEMADDKMEMDDDKMDHGKVEMDHDSKKMDHGSMGMDGVIMLQDEVIEGIKGSAHLMDMEGGMGQMLMVMFTEVDGGKMITKGKVAVKVESPDEKIGAAKKMKKSKGMFGTGVKFEQKGMYHFKVGTKLADGEKRTFHFHHEN